MNRESYITREAPLEERERVWNDAVIAINTHIQTGIALQKQGIEILENLSIEDISVEIVIKACSQAAGIIEKGIAIEQASRQKLIELYQQKPVDL